MPEDKKPEFKKDDKPKKLKRFLVDRQIQQMISLLIRDKQSFVMVKDQMMPERFPEDLQHLGGLWSVVSSHYEQFEKMPDAETIRGGVEEWLQEVEVDDRQMEDLSRIINQAFATPLKEVKAKREQTLRLTQRFLSEVIQRQLQQQITTGVAVELPRLLESMHQQVQAVESLELGSLELPFPEDLTKMTVINKVPTECDFIDRYLNGGQAAGEVYGLLAPYGVGKTTCAVQLSVNRAKYEQAGWQEMGRQSKLPVVYVFFYEEDMTSVRPRALSYAGEVEKNIIEEGRWSEMSRRSKKNYKKYERHRFKEAFDSGMPVPGEWERVESAKKRLSLNLRLVDFMGVRTANQGFASNYVDGIVSYIDRDQSLCGRPGVSMILIDYVGAAADRYCQARNLDPAKQLRHLIGKMPLRVKNQLAAPLGCPVWLFHQLSTEANALKPGAAPKITQASEAHNFAENLSFCFMLGTKTNDQLAVMTNVKQRRAAKQDDCVVHIDGLFSRIVSTGSMYRLDNSKIVRADEYNRVADVVNDDSDEPVGEDTDRDAADYVTIGAPCAVGGKRRGIKS